MKKRIQWGLVIGWVWLVTAPVATAALCRDSIFTEFECDNGRSACKTDQCGFCLDDGPNGGGSFEDCDDCCATLGSDPDDVSLCEETSCRA